MASSLEKLVTSHGVTVDWRSFELRPREAPPLAPEYKEKIMAGRPRLYAIAKEQYGLDLNQGPWGIDSRPALIGAKYAEAQGAGPAYHEGVLRAYWHEARDISETAVLVAIAEAAGLARDAFVAALANPIWEEAVLGDVATAHSYGINGVPALVFQDKYLVSGAQPYTVLTEVVEKIQAEEAAA